VDLGATCTAFDTHGHHCTTWTPSPRLLLCTTQVPAPTPPHAAFVFPCSHCPAVWDKKFGWNFHDYGHKKYIVHRKEYEHDDEEDDDEYDDCDDEDNDDCKEKVYYRICYYKKNHKKVSGVG
jgi:hypothetical protein